MTPEHMTSERYECYKHGWLQGASGERVTPNPPISIQHKGDFMTGFEDGRDAFSTAMKRSWEFLAQSP